MSGQPDPDHRRHVLHLCIRMVVFSMRGFCKVSLFPLVDALEWRLKAAEEGIPNPKPPTQSLPKLTLLRCMHAGLMCTLLLLDVMYPATLRTA